VEGAQGRSEKGEDSRVDREGETLERRGHVRCSNTMFRLGMSPLLVRWNEFAGTPLEAPLDGSITIAAYRGYMRSKQLRRTYTGVKLSNRVRISGHRD
jgi:hypothetical protein